MSTTTETTGKSVISAKDKERALKLVEGAKSTKAPDNLSLGNHDAVIKSSEFAVYQGKDTGIRFNIETNTGVPCFSSIAPESKEKAKKLIETDGIVEGLKVTLHVYDIQAEYKNSTTTGNYCRIIL